MVWTGTINSVIKQKLLAAEVDILPFFTQTSMRLNVL